MTGELVGLETVAGVADRRVVIRQAEDGLTIGVEARGENGFEATGQALQFGSTATRATLSTLVQLLTDLHLAAFPTRRNPHA